MHQTKGLCLLVMVTNKMQEFSCGFDILKKKKEKSTKLSQ